jgi:hypothetical protein
MAEPHESATRASRATKRHVVAELGRPETPEETAARTSAAARNRRSHQTPVNLVLSLVASLGVVFVIVLLVVRTSPPAREPVDYQRVAAQAQSAVDTPLASPVLPAHWSANAANLNSASADRVVSWYIGFITPDEQFIGLRQGIEANATWVANQVQNASTTGSDDIAGTTWTVYDHRDAHDSGNLAYALTTTIGPSSYVLFGTAKTDEFHVLAKAIAAEAEENTTKGTIK